MKACLREYKVKTRALFSHMLLPVQAQIMNFTVCQVSENHYAGWGHEMFQQSGWECIFLPLDGDWPFLSMGHREPIYEWFAPSHPGGSTEGSSDNTRV